MTDTNDHHNNSRPSRRRGMRPATKLATFALVLGAAFGVGAAVGSVAGPIDVTDAEPDHGTEVDHGEDTPGPTTTIAPMGHDDDHRGPTDG